MQVNIVLRESQKKYFIEAMTAFYVQYLKLTRSKYTLSIILKKGQRTETGSNGITGHLGKDIFVSLEASMGVSQLMSTLAHEMVHVKQIAKGQLLYMMKKTTPVSIWMGKDLSKVPYLQQPWEVEAFSKSELMVRHLEACFIK